MKSKLIEKIKKLGKNFEPSEQEVRDELLTFYYGEDYANCRRLLFVLSSFYDKNYSGYRNYSDAFDWAFQDLERFTWEIDEDLFSDDKMQKFYMKSLGFNPVYSKILEEPLLFYLD